MGVSSDLILGGAFTFFVYHAINFYRVRSKIANIPSVGSDHFLLAYFDAWKFVVKGQDMIKEGYRKYPGTAFKVPTLTTESGWVVVVSGDKMVEDLRKASPDELSFRGASLELLQTQHQLGHHAYDVPFHVGVARTPLTRTFPSQFGEVSDEIRVSCNELLDCGTDWKEFQIYDALTHIVCRTSNRLFVGLPLCRNAEFLKIQETWTMHVMLAANILNVVPSIMKPLLGAMLFTVRSAQKRTREMIGPLIEERLAKVAEYGSDWEGKPNDLISWLIDEAPPHHRNVEDITIKVMLINLAAIHTTSLTLAGVFFDLAARQEYIAPLRTEIEQAIGEQGWTKEAMGQMRKLDSFLRESSRLSGIGGISMRRKVTKDFTFSNGITVPKGYSIAVASAEIQSDPAFYEDPDTFKGFRFFDMRKDGAEELDSIRHQMVSLEPTYLLFGYGRHACPGRFFAVNEVKAIIAHVILNYDIQLPGGLREPPPPFWFAGNRSPSRGARVMLRKRKVD